MASASNAFRRPVGYPDVNAFKQYTGDSGDYLKTPEKLSLTEKGYRDVQQANAMCGRTDPSIDSMYVLDVVSGKVLHTTHGDFARPDPAPRPPVSPQGKKKVSLQAQLLKNNKNRIREKRSGTI